MRLGVVALVAACGPGARMEHPDAAVPLPPGVWELERNASRVSVTAGPNGSLWWGYATTTVKEDLTRDVVTYEYWLAQTSPTGERLITPVLVDAPGQQARTTAVAADADDVLVAMHGYGEAVHVRYFDSHGRPRMDAAVELSLFPATTQVERISSLALAPSSSGTFRLVAAFDEAAATSEVIVAPLTPDGQLAPAMQLGTADDGWPEAVAAATRADDSLVVAWDRMYDQCFGPRPASTFAARIDATTVDGPGLVRDLPERGETKPAIATAGDTTYVAWQADAWGGRAQIAVARYPELGNVLAELGEVTSYATAPQLALAAPGRGVVAWRTVRDDNSTDEFLKVVSFEDVGGALLVSAAHTIEPVGEGAWLTLVGIVPVGDNRFVLAWNEATNHGGHQYATQLDVAADVRQRPAPRPQEPARAATPPTGPRGTLGRTRPCTH